MVPSNPPRNTLAMIAVKLLNCQILFDQVMDFALTYRFGSVGTLAVGSKSQELDPTAVKVALRFLETIFRLHSRLASLPRHFQSDSIPLSQMSFQITNSAIDKMTKEMLWPNVECRMSKT